MIPSYNHRFLLITRVRGASLQPAQLRERLNSILDQRLESRCQLLFCDDRQTELGWLIQSSRPYHTLEASLSRLVTPDSFTLLAAGTSLERFELFEQYEARGLSSVWQRCRNLAGRMCLPLLIWV